MVWKMASVRPLLHRSGKGVRAFSTTSACFGLRNFRKIVLHGFRGGRRFIERQKTNPDPDIPVYDYGVREPGYYFKGKFHLVPEMIPELIVPDLTNFQLKPYVSYKVQTVVQTEFTAKDLFDAVYSEKITNDYLNKKLDKDGNSIEPNEFEKLTPEEAKKNARQTGSDYFMETVEGYKWLHS